MKRKTTQVILILTIIFISTYAINAQKIGKFIGSWDFKAPSASYGNETGILEIKKCSVIITFTGNSFKYQSDWVNCKSDTLKFNFYLDGEYIKCYLNVEDAYTLNGYAKWYPGETTLILTRRKIQDSAATKQE